MQKWEYLQVTTYGAVSGPPDFVHANGQMVLQRKGTNTIALNDYFCHLGEQGWEMVSHVYLVCIRKP